MTVAMLMQVVGNNWVLNTAVVCIPYKLVQQAKAQENESSDLRQGYSSRECSLPIHLHHKGSGIPTSNHTNHTASKIHPVRNSHFRGKVVFICDGAAPCPVTSSMPFAQLFTQHDIMAKTDSVKLNVENFVVDEVLFQTLICFCLVILCGNGILTT